MEEVEVERAILQYVYDHRGDHPDGLVDLCKSGLLESAGEMPVYQSVRYLEEEEWIRVWDDSRKLVSLTAQGKNLMRDPEQLKLRFPIRLDVPPEIADRTEIVVELLQGKYNPVLEQFNKAKSFLYDSTPPDYLNSIKESVGAVEGLARIVLDEPKKTLSQLMPQLTGKYLGHPAMGKIFDAVFAVRGDEPGVAHGAHESSALGHEDAELIFQTCSALIIYLARKAGPYT